MAASVSQISDVLREERSLAAQSKTVVLQKSITELVTGHPGSLKAVSPPGVVSTLKTNRQLQHSFKTLLAMVEKDRRFKKKRKRKVFSVYCIIIYMDSKKI